MFITLNIKGSSSIIINADKIYEIIPKNTEGDTNCCYIHYEVGSNMKECIAEIEFPVIAQLLQSKDGRRKY